MSEYGITVRWDKNFLTIVYLTLARNRHVRFFGGVRFGGTITLEDAWALGFDHVAISAGAGRPTIIDMKNNLARGIRKASDFLMALQLYGRLQAHEHREPAGEPARDRHRRRPHGHRHRDRAARLLPGAAREGARALRAARPSGKRAADVRKLFDDEEWVVLERHLGHARQLRDEKRAAEKEGREPNVQKLLDGWGGVTLVYRKGLRRLARVSPDHEEVAKALEEGIRYAENMSPDRGGARRQASTSRA